jgi:hypothetical protein
MCELGTALTIIGLATNVGGALAQGQATADAANQNIRYAEEQKLQEAQLSHIRDTQLREQFRQALGRQRLEMGARGVSLDSPSALVLGDTAAREMSLASQEVRAESGARVAELTAEQRRYRAEGRLALLTGKLSAAGSFLTKAPDIWPSLKSSKVLA